MGGREPVSCARSRVGNIFVPHITLKNVTFHVTKVFDVSLEKEEENRGSRLTKSAMWR